MGGVYDLFGWKSFDTDIFYELNRNTNEFVRRLKKYLVKKYKTLFAVNREPAGHISFRFKGKREEVRQDMNKLIQELERRGVSNLWVRGILDMGSISVGMIESLVLDVLYGFYDKIKSKNK